jgi:propanol-preferring alcohol dehydrogenase
MGLPSEQNAAVKTGSGHDAKAPVKRIAVPQEPGPG